MSESERSVLSKDAERVETPVRTGPGRPRMQMWVDPDMSAVESVVIYGDQAKEIGHRIQQIRKNQVGGSQRDFAETLGVSRGLVSHWEVGRGINRHHLVQIGAVFNISLYWLIDGRGRPEMMRQQKVLERIVAERRMSLDDADKFWTELLAFAEFRLAAYPQAPDDSDQSAGNGETTDPEI